MIIVAIALSFGPISAYGQSLYGQRLASKDGKWLLPVATRILGSTDDDHVRRGSINSWDLSAAVGSPVWAAAPGVVQAAGCNLYESRQWARMQGYGCSVELSHGNGISSQYGHCAPNTIRVKRGDQVTQNTLLCQVGRTGVTSFDHTHFTILRNGSPIRIDSIFDINQMQRCHLCSGKNDPNAPVAAGAIQPGQQPTATGQQSATIAPNRLTQLLQLLRTVKPEVISMTVVGFLGLLALVWWLGGQLERIFVVSLGTSTIVVAVGLWLVMPVAGQVQASGLSAGLPVPADGVWKLAYQFVTRWEGERCTADGAHTYAGVTQGAWNRFTSRHGLPKSDVCAAKPNKDVRGMVFYEDYWLGSGADKLPGSIAIIHSDFAYNVGTGANGPAMRILRQCGNDAQCYIERRLSWYLNECGNCAQGHINRTMDVVNYIKRLQQKGQ